MPPYFVLLNIFLKDLKVAVGERTAIHDLEQDFLPVCPFAPTIECRNGCELDLCDMETGIDRSIRAIKDKALVAMALEPVAEWRHGLRSGAAGRRRGGAAGHWSLLGFNNSTIIEI